MQNQELAVVQAATTFNEYFHALFPCTFSCTIKPYTYSHLFLAINPFLYSRFFAADLFPTFGTYRELLTKFGAFVHRV